MKFTIRDTFNGRNISNHRTLRAALETESKFLKSVRKSNGSSSYIPTKILCNGEPMIAREFADSPYNIIFERTATPSGSGVEGNCEAACDDVRLFIQENWTAAL